MVIKKKAVPLYRNQKTNNIMEATIFYGIISFFAIAFCATCIYAIIDIAREWMEDSKKEKEFDEYWKATKSEREEQSNKMKKQIKMKQIVTDNAELLEVLEANGISIICNDDMKMMVTDTDATRIDAIVAEKAPAAFADYVIC